MQDIVSIKPIDETEVMDSVTKGKEQVEAINQAFIAMDEEGASRLEETQDDLKTMQTFLSEMSKKFVDSASISSYSVESTRDMSALNAIKEEVYDKDHTVSDANDKLDNMSMSEIEDKKNDLINQLDKTSQAFLNTVHSDFENGEINRETLQLIMKELKDSNLSEMDSDSQVYVEKIYQDYKDKNVDSNTLNS